MTSNKVPASAASAGPQVRSSANESAASSSAANFQRGSIRCKNEALQSGKSKARVMNRVMGQVAKLPWRLWASWQPAPRGLPSILSVNTATNKRFVSRLENRVMIRADGGISRYCWRGARKQAMLARQNRQTR